MHAIVHFGPGQLCLSGYIGAGGGFRLGIGKGQGATGNHHSSQDRQDHTHLFHLSFAPFCVLS